MTLESEADRIGIRKIGNFIIFSTTYWCIFPDEMSVPFDKEHLKSQITAGGGTLLDNIDEKMVS
jgi:hypothetical protein